MYISQLHGNVGLC